MSNEDELGIVSPEEFLEDDGGESLRDSVLTYEEAEDLDAAQPTLSAISYSTNDFDVDGLVRRFQSGDILIPRFGFLDSEKATAGFQRSFVWTKKQMDRFIESLLLEYPIPSFFLVRQPDKKYLVLDGQQRLITLKCFLENRIVSINKLGVEQVQEFSLKNVSIQFENLTINSLSDAQRRTLKDTFLTAVVVSTDNSIEAQENIYKIFERLNSGGTQLTPHEIRVALYSGKLMDSLDELNQLPSWRVLFGKTNSRLRDQELILRILAFYLKEDYEPPLKGFLNEFAGEYRYCNTRDIQVAMDRFREVSDFLAKSIGRRVLRREKTGGVNAAQSEAIFVAIMRQGVQREMDADDVYSGYLELINSEDFSKATETGTSSTTSVSTRFDMAVKAFSVR